MPSQKWRPVTLTDAGRAHLKKYWTIPARANAKFAARMEDVLLVYARIYDLMRLAVYMVDFTTATPINNCHAQLVRARDQRS